MDSKKSSTLVFSRKEMLLKTLLSGQRRTIFSVNGDSYCGEWKDSFKHGNFLLIDVETFRSWSSDLEVKAANLRGFMGVWQKKWPWCVSCNRHGWKTHQSVLWFLEGQHATRSFISSILMYFRAMVKTGTVVTSSMRESGIETSDAAGVATTTKTDQCTKGSGFTTNVGAMGCFDCVNRR